MPQAPVFTQSSPLNFLNFILFFASSAALLPPVSLKNDIPLALSPTANLTSNISAIQNGHIRCILPFPHPVDPVNFRICQPTIDRLLSYPWANSPRTYRVSEGRRGVVKITSTVCAISLDRQEQKGEITISLRQIVQSVERILLFCIASGEGGWQYVDPPWADWIVVVEGTGDMEVGRRNATVGEIEEGGVVDVGEEE